jgi:UDP-glucose 4-epimerase
VNQAALSNNRINSEGYSMNNFKDANFTVTGGAGFIGFHLCRKLLELEANVQVFDNLSTGTMNNLRDLPKSIKFVKGDVRKLEGTEAKLAGCDAVFHLAAQRDVVYSMRNPAEDVEINVLGTLKVLEWARKTDSKMIFASTAAVYGNGQKSRPTSEKDPISPISTYGLSKAAGEEECLFYHRNYGVPLVILRIFNVYGPRGHGVTADFLQHLRENPHQLKILGTGSQSRDLFYVSDLVEALMLSVNSKKAEGEAYNVGSGTAVTVKQLADMMIKLLGLKSVTKITCAGGQAWEGDLKINYANISKAKKDLGWQPCVKLTDGLRMMIKEETLSNQ